MGNEIIHALEENMAQFLDNLGEENPFVIMIQNPEVMQD